MSATLNGPSDAQYEQNFSRELLLKLRRRKGLITLITVVLALLLGIAIQLLPKVYHGVVTIEVQTRAPHVVRTMDDLTNEQAGFTTETIGTELEILKSPQLLRQVVDKLHLVASPEFNPDLQPSLLHRLATPVVAWGRHLAGLPPAPPPVPLNDTILRLQSRLVMTPVSHSRVIQIVASAHDPALAAKVANTMAQAYVEWHVTARNQLARATNEFTDQRLGELQKNATAAAQAVEAYRNAHDLILGRTGTLLQEQLTEASTALLAASAAESTLQGQYEAAKTGNDEQLAAALTSPTIARLRDREAQVSAKLAADQSRYSYNQGIIRQDEAALQAVRRQIADEARRLVSSLPSQLRAAQDKVASLRTQLETLSTKTGSLDAARAQLLSLEDNSKAARKLYADFLTRSQETSRNLEWKSAAAANVSVLSNAVVPLRPVFPSNPIMLPAAFILALGAGLSTALVLESRPRGLVSMEEIEDLFPGIPTLGMIPVRTHKTKGMYEDAIEQLWNRLMFGDGVRPRSILITSALPEEGKTTTAQALAEAATHRGMRVLLIDGDMRSHRQPFSGTAIGLADVLRGEAESDKVLRATPSMRLATLPAGRQAGSPTRLLAMPGVEGTFRSLIAAHDLVIIDAPPALIGGDVWLLSRVADQTVFLAKWGATSPHHINTAFKLLLSNRARGPAPIAGLVLNMVDPVASQTYGHGDAVMFSAAMRRYYH